jgi:hypothetical protein
MIQAVLIFHIVAVLVVLAAMFVKLPGLRPAAVVLAAIAICLPYVLLRASLSHPNPNPIAGRYEMYAVKQDIPHQMLYMLVGERGRDGPPRLFSMPMSPRDGQDREGASFGRNYSIIDITVGNADTPEVSSSDEEYDLPDPDKEAYYRKLRGESGGNN